MADSTDLFTTVKNTSGVSKVFSFLPWNGKRLAADEEYTFVGGIVEGLAANPSFTLRKTAALARALVSGDLTIVNTPAPILYDNTLDESKALTLDSGTLATADPSWAGAGESAS